MQTTTIPNRTLLLIAAGSLVAIAIAFGIGWGLTTGGDRTDQTGALAGPTPGATSTSPVVPTPDGPGTPAPLAGQPGGGNQTGGNPPPGPPPPPAGPRIDFRVVQEPRCPRGTNQAPIEGRPLVLEWRVTGADTVALSIDGSGIYDTYPAKDDDTFSFACAGEPGDIERHTYLLTATGGGQIATAQLVVEAEVYEIPQV